MLCVKHITLENNNDYFLITFCKDDSDQIEISLISLERDNYLKGILCEEYMRSKAIQMRIPYEEYVKDTKIALNCNKSCDTTFVYNIKNDCDQLVFEWKKLIEDEIKILFGYVILDDLSMKEVIYTVLDNVTTEMSRFHNLVDQLTEESNYCKEEKDKAMILLDETAQWKQNLENELYTKFVMVLNSKKEKIKELKSQLEQLQNTKNNYNQPSAKSDNKTEKTTKLEKESESDLFFEDDVDIKPLSTRVGRYISNQSAKSNKKNLQISDIEIAGPSNYKNPKIKRHKSTTSTVISDSQDLFNEL